MARDISNDGMLVMKIKPKYFIIKCKIHKGEIYALSKDDNICGGCAKKQKKPVKPKKKTR